MRNKIWFNRYLFFIGWLIVALGITLVFENFQRRSYPGVLLGIAFLFYGFLRLRQRKIYPLER